MSLSVYEIIPLCIHILLFNTKSVNMWSFATTVGKKSSFMKHHGLNCTGIIIPITLIKYASPENIT